MRAGGKKVLVAPPEGFLGVPRECAFRCSPHVRTRPPRGLGVPKFSRGPPRKVLGTPLNPRKRIWGVTLGLQRGFQGALSGLRSTILAPQDGLGR